MNQKVKKGLQLFLVVYDDYNYSTMVKMVSNGFKWSPIVSNVLKWFKMVSKVVKVFKYSKYTKQASSSVFSLKRINLAILLSIPLFLLVITLVKTKGWRFFIHFFCSTRCWLDFVKPCTGIHVDES